MSNPKTSLWAIAVASIAGLSLTALMGCAAPKPDESTPVATASPAAPAPAQTAANPVERQEQALDSATKAPSAPFEGEGWKSLFDGRSLSGWSETKFSGHGEVEVRDGMILMKMGDPFTGIGWTNEFPKMNYELAMDAMRVNGSDFFCGLTAPVGDSFCSLIVGGWGGGLVGISSLDGMDASENETTKYQAFLQNHWYRIRLRVTHDRLEGWIDQDKLIDVVTTGKRISLRPGEIEESKPMGVACWQTTAALRQIKVRQVEQPADPPKKTAY